jgi:hypothetical protein
MNRSELLSGSGTLRIALNRCENHRVLSRAAQRIRWLPGVLSVAVSNGELEVVFCSPAEQMVRQIHHAQATDRNVAEA